MIFRVSENNKHGIDENYSIFYTYCFEKGYDRKTCLKLKTWKEKIHFKTNKK